MHSNSRQIRPEILDGLEATDARAVRGRRDLRLINALMGNPGWVLRSLKSCRPFRSVAEIGAGEGRLCSLVSQRWPSATVTGIDLVPRAPELPGNIIWRQGDLFELVPTVAPDVLVGVMIAHHFPDGRVRELGGLVGKTLCLCEPLRSPLSRFWAAMLMPLVGPVTQHDMPASIAAGFRPGELPGLLGLDGKKWTVKESVDWRGAIRLIAWRN